MQSRAAVRLARPPGVGGAGPALTVTLAVPVMVLLCVSVAVTVCAPVVLRVTRLVKVWTPISVLVKV